MIQASKQYKEIMNRPIRNRGYISVGIGIINQEAKKNGKVTSDIAYWSSGDIFSFNVNQNTYCTLEEKFFKADGSMLFPPEKDEDELYQLLQNGISSKDILGEIRIDFSKQYDIKGLTVDFGEYYPTNFTVTTEAKVLNFENDKKEFITMEVLGITSYVIITPITMIGGQQRLRIKNIRMGVGLVFQDAETKTSSLTQFTSSISQELPSHKFTISAFDQNNYFNVDDQNSFIGYLENMQEVNVSYGIELDNGEAEMIQVARLFLNEWGSTKGQVSFTATDRFAHMDSEYSLGNRIYNRTAYDEAVGILTDAGLEPDQYLIDEYLRDINLINPMPVTTHKEALQILANACRCILFQNEYGRITIKANFAIVLDPDEMSVETDDYAAWSKPENILIGSKYVYANLTKKFFKTDGSMYFLPEDENYLETGYVSNAISDENGEFSENPKFSIILPAAFNYYGVNLVFDGNTPKTLIIHTFENDKAVENITFTDLDKESYLSHEFKPFDKMTFEFAKTVPHNQILVSKVSFGDITDYKLRKFDMKSEPTGYREEKTQKIKVKIFSYRLNEDGEPEEIEDNVYVDQNVHVTGTIRKCENPLIATKEHAELVAEWLGNYYGNNVSYDVTFRGEPRINAADIIHMESDVLNNLQVEVEEVGLTYNGAYSGTLSLRKALRVAK